MITVAERVDRALSHAPYIADGTAPVPLVYPPTTGTEIAGGYATFSNTHIAEYHGADDYEPMTINTMYQAPANAIETINNDEFGELLAESLCRMGYTQPQLRAEVIRTQIHEARHKFVWETLGAPAVELGVRFGLYTVGDEDRITFRAYTASIDAQAPKLGVAAAAAAPHDPSLSDYKMISDLGYTLNTLGEKIITHNTSGRKPYIPVPHSYPPKNYLLR